VAPSLPVIHVGADGGSNALAFERGYFTQLGVPAERGPQISTGDVKLRTAALLSGQLDATGLAVNAGFFNAAGQGAGFKMVGGQDREEPGASSATLVVRTALIDSGRVQSNADLKGLRIGLVGHDVGEFEVEQILQAGGLSLSDVSLPVMTDFQSMSAALMTGAVDAGVFPETFIPPLVNSGIGTRWLPVGDIVPGVQTHVLVFSSRLLANHELAVRTMMAYLCGFRDFADAFFKNINRDQVVQELIQATPIKDPALYNHPYSAVDANGQVNLANMQEQLSWYRQMGYVTEQVDLASLYDPSIAEEAVARLGRYE
jgi:NitT/TauT family transport system substrate-binding protein